MAISDKYRNYLAHFGATRPCRDALALPAGEPAILLRHDVDHDLDIALEMARVEHDAGFGSTYFLLHTAAYWNDPALADKCLQLQDYGHEVGLHVNLLTEWMRGEIDDPAVRLRELLAPLRARGVRIDGISAHGDRACYERNFINYWCFRELRPADPAADEDGRTAEGPRDITHRSRVAYPAGHALARADGRTLPLWSVSMAEAGIAYHAWHLPCDQYFSDSGGGWTRSADPLGADLSRGRHQVLMHPLYWQGRKRTYFFLSTARSGSKWLARFLDAATPLAVRHEYMLNQAYFDGEASDKQTAAYGRLAADRDRVGRLLADAWERRDRVDKDYAEVNVYLESQPDLLRSYFPDARYVLLTRDPRQVVRSIVNRGWYETPVDLAHRAVDAPEWAAQGQFGRACLYVADTLRRLRGLCSDHIRLEDATADLAGLTRRLEALGIVVHPRLAAAAHGQVVDPTGKFAFPRSEAWTPEQGAAYARFCGPQAAALGYDGGAAASAASPAAAAAAPPAAPPPPEILHDGPPPPAARWRLHGYRAEPGAPDACIAPTPDNLARRHATLGGYPWQPGVARAGRRRLWRIALDRLHTLGARLAARAARIAGGAAPPAGWPARPGTWITGGVQAELTGRGRVALYLLGFDGRSNRLIQKKMLGVLTAERGSLEIACRVHPDADRFDIAFYSLLGEPAAIAVSGLTLRQEPMPQAYSALEVS